MLPPALDDFAIDSDEDGPFSSIFTREMIILH